MTYLILELAHVGNFTTSIDLTKTALSDDALECKVRNVDGLLVHFGSAATHGARGKKRKRKSRGAVGGGECCYKEEVIFVKDDLRLLFAVNIRF